MKIIVFLSEGYSCGARHAFDDSIIEFVNDKKNSKNFAVEKIRNKITVNLDYFVQIGYEDNMRKMEIFS